tara:strand:+ start:2039 stop:3148 length:1110 start_codon:yes stop_codon:yes gene_type:complete
MTPEKANYPRLTSKLLALSQSDDYEEAKLEWRITGRVWRQTIGGINSNGITLRTHPCGHPSFCLCGHPITYHFEIENTITGVKEIVGSTCIGSWMVLRHMSEKLNILKSTITEEMIEVWKQEAVQGLVKDAWWASEGKRFTFIFNEIKDLDLRINVRQTGKQYFDKKLKKYVAATEIRKRASGEYQSEHYEMASIVWRWNHPNNPKAQINISGYPNERLLQDLYWFHIHIKEHLETISKEDILVDARMEVLQTATVKFNHKLAGAMLETKENSAFSRLCESKSMPYFDISFASNEWEADFIKRMRVRLTDGDTISPKQQTVLIRIVKNQKEMATEKQINYLKSLKYEADFALLTKNAASKEIDRLIKKR